jgi:hypothetical protein
MINHYNDVSKEKNQMHRLCRSTGNEWSQLAGNVWSSCCVSCTLERHSSGGSSLMPAL